MQGHFEHLLDGIPIESCFINPLANYIKSRVKFHKINVFLCFLSSIRQFFSQHLWGLVERSRVEMADGSILYFCQSTPKPEGGCTVTGVFDNWPPLQTSMLEEIVRFIMIEKTLHFKNVVTLVSHVNVTWRMSGTRNQAFLYYETNGQVVMVKVLSNSTDVSTGGGVSNLFWHVTAVSQFNGRRSEFRGSSRAASVHYRCTISQLDYSIYQSFQIV